VIFNRYAPLLQACNNGKASTQGTQIHTHMLKYGVDIASNLAWVCANSGSIVNDRNVIVKIFGQSVFHGMARLEVMSSMESVTKA
jgi:hypothetical protein